MEKINFQNNVTKANAETFNTMQDNIEDAISDAVTQVEGEIPTIDSSTSISSTNPVENQAITNYVDSEISTLSGQITNINTLLGDIVKLVSVNSGGFTLNGNSSVELSITIPNQPGYKCLGCIGGSGNGNTGLLVSACTWYGDINRWVFNTSDVTRTYASASFILLYIRDI